MPFPTSTSTRSNHSRSHTPSTPNPPSSLSHSDWVSISADFAPTPSKSKILPSSHARNGSLASKIYRALSINRRDSVPSSPRVTISDISSPFPVPHTPIYSDYTVGTDHTPTPSERSASVGRSMSWHLHALADTSLRHMYPLDESGTPTSRPVVAVTAPRNGATTLSSIAHSSRDFTDSPPSSQLRGDGAGLRQSTSHSRHCSIPAAQALSSKLSIKSKLSDRPLTPLRQGSGNSVWIHSHQLSHPSAPPSPLSARTTRSCRPNSPAGTVSLRSTASSQFRIRRKAPPRLTDDEFFAANGFAREPVRQSSLPEKRSLEKEKVGEETPTSARVARHQSLDMRPPQPEEPTSKLELDRLFDELFDECRAGAAIRTGTPLSSSSGHRRSQSDFPELHSSSLRRVTALRKPSRGILNSSQGDNVPNPKADDPRLKGTKSRGNPFFTSGRQFDSLRTSSRPRTGPVGSSSPLKLVRPSTPGTPGRVRNAVLEIERKHSTPNSRVSTPIKHLGSILDRSSSVDSAELTLESKRLMEAARQRRSIR